MDGPSIEHLSNPSDLVSAAEDLDEMDILKYSDSEEGDDAGVVGNIFPIRAKLKNVFDAIEEGNTYIQIVYKTS